MAKRWRKVLFPCFKERKKTYGKRYACHLEKDVIFQCLQGKILIKTYNKVLKPGRLKAGSMINNL